MNNLSANISKLEIIIIFIYSKLLKAYYVMDSAKEKNSDVYNMVFNYHSNENKII